MLTGDFTAVIGAHATCLTSGTPVKRYRHVLVGCDRNVALGVNSGQHEIQAPHLQVVA